MAANDTVLPSESGESDQNKEDSASRTAKKYGGKKSPGAPRQTKLPSCSLPTNMIPTFYVGGGNGVALVEAPLLNLGWKRTHDKYDERFRLKWVECKSKLNYSTFKEGEQLVNHIPNANLLTNKLGLLNSLQEYERVTLSTKGRPPRLRFSDFVPETYRLDETKDREEFLRIYNEGELWICKPTGMNQGKGIFILRSKEEISKLLEEREMKKEQKTKGFRPLMTRVVQRYIDNPLLLEGRKFDIRAYMLIASTVPYLLLYHKGYVRLCCNKYNHDDTNLSTHLTNQFVQKKDPNYKEIKEDTAWSIEKFNQYINESIQPKTEGMETDWVYCSLTKQMQKIMIHCFNSVKHKLQSRLGYFDLFGLDFMVDTNLKVWLIEVNVNPALHTNCTALKEVIPGVVEETLNVVIEAFDKSKKHQPLLPLNSMKGFSVLYCGSRLNTITSTRQTRSVSPVKDSSTERRNIGTASARQPSPNRHRMTTVSTPVVSTGPVSSTVKKAEPVTVSSSGRSPISSAAPNPGSGAVKLRLMHAGDKEADNNKEKADEEKPVEGDTNNSADKNSDETAEDDKDNSNTTDSSLIDENTDNEKSEEKSVAPQKLGGTGNSNSNAIPNKNNVDNKQKPTEAIKTGRSAIADAIKNSGAISNSLTAATAASAAKTQPSLHRYPARPKNQGETKPFVRSSSQVETKSTLKPSVATVKSFQEQDLKLAFSKTQETSAVAASQKNSSSQGTKVLPTLSLTTSTNGNLPTQQIKTAVITVTSSDSVEGMKLSSVQSNSAAACLMNNQTTSGKLLINDLSSSATVTFPSITGSYSGDLGTSNNQGFTGTKYLNNALNNANGTPYSARRRSKDRDRPDRGN